MRGSSCWPAARPPRRTLAPPGRPVHPNWVCYEAGSGPAIRVDGTGVDGETVRTELRPGHCTGYFTVAHTITVPAGWTASFELLRGANRHRAGTGSLTGPATSGDFHRFGHDTEVVITGVSRAPA